MQIQQVLRQRLASALQTVSPECFDLASMVRPTQDPTHGDFQINSAMPMAKRLGINPREAAAKIVQQLQVEDFCQPPELAGPGFINLRLKDDYIAKSARRMLDDDRLSVQAVDQPLNIVIDYSSPNVAKPMHVGHIRSTVIGDALARILKFLGHNVITDNHLGDWGTQFGMIIYGYRHFLDVDKFNSQPVAELLRIYRTVNRLIDHSKAVESLPALRAQITVVEGELQTARTVAAESKEPKEAKKAGKQLATVEKRTHSAAVQLESTERKLAIDNQDADFMALASIHSTIPRDVLEETAKLHAGDADNMALWTRLLPYCMEEINRVYQRLNIRFDHVLGESFYHPMLAEVVAELRSKGLATDSEGAVCLFLDNFDAPMIVQKQDGAYLYATTDIATLRYRRDTFAADEILYVVDFRQGDHFQKLFAVAASMGMSNAKLVHVSFGTVLDAAGRPLKTRSGSLAGLVELLDDAVRKAYEVVCAGERNERLDPPLSDVEKTEIAEIVGIGAIKYADLSHHRTSDYKFSLDKMIAFDGNTSAYIQYAYSRIQGILTLAGKGEREICDGTDPIICGEPTERSLLLSLLRFEEVLLQVRDEYAPNVLVEYLYEIAKGLAAMYEQCMVLKAEDPAVRASRLAIITLVARTLRKGLELLGIQVIPRM